jgi:hypothetical protein
VPTMVEETDLEMAWTQLPPGPELAIHLALVDWDTLPDRELVAAMAAARRQTSWTQSRQLAAVGELAARRYARDGRGDSEVHRRVAAEVSIELNVTQGQAEQLVFLAHDLPGRLPTTWTALQCGQIDYERAEVMADALAALDDHQARALDDDLAEAAAQMTTTRLKRHVKRAVRAADPDAAAEQTAKAKAERRLELWDNADDTCDLIGRNMDAATAHAIFNRLTAAATAMKADGDVRTIGQIRHDLLAALGRGVPLPDAVRHLLTNQPDADPASATSASATTATAGMAGSANHGPDGGGGPFGGATASTTTEPGAAARRAPDNQPDATDVIAAVESLIARALADATDEHLTGLLDRARANGRLDTLTLWIGQAVQAVNDALTDIVDAWCRTTGTNPGTGRHGHDGYRPPAALARLIHNRHPACVFPTCSRRAARCDLDHTTPYDQGGRTCKCNLAPLCRTHHRIVKQHPAWTLLQPWPGLLVWIAPAGTWHIVTPQ